MENLIYKVLLHATRHGQPAKAALATEMLKYYQYDDIEPAEYIPAFLRRMKSEEASALLADISLAEIMVADLI